MDAVEGGRKLEVNVIWKRVSPYAIALVTPRGTYHVSKGASGGRVRYCAWPPAPTAGMDAPWQDRLHTMLGCFDDADAAKRCCEEHAG